MSEVIWEVREDIVKLIYDSWSSSTPSNSSRDWYNHCDQIGLKKSPAGGWMVDTESELTMLLLRLKR